MAGVQETVALVRAGSPRRVFRGYDHTSQHWDGGGLGGRPAPAARRRACPLMGRRASGRGPNPSAPRTVRRHRRRLPRCAPRPSTRPAAAPDAPPRRPSVAQRVCGTPAPATPATSRAAAVAAAAALCGAPPAWGPPRRPRRGAPATPPPRAAAFRRPCCTGGHQPPRPTGARTARAATKQAATSSVRDGLGGGCGTRPPREPGAVGTPRWSAAPPCTTTPARLAKSRSKWQGRPQL